jgi:hypothetical protein
MPTLQLIQENSNTCPSTGSSTGVSIPIILMGTVGVLFVVGMVYSGKTKSEQVV